MKRSILISIVIFVALIQIGCNFKGPETVVRDYLDSIKSTDFDKALSITTGKHKPIKDEELYENQAQKEFIKAVFSNISYKILKATENKGMAQVEIKITSPELSKIVEDITKEFLPLAFKTANSYSEKADKELEHTILKYATKSLLSSDYPKRTEKIIIDLKREMFSWKVVPNKKLFKVLLGDS